MTMVQNAPVDFAVCRDTDARIEMLTTISAQVTADEFLQQLSDLSTCDAEGLALARAMLDCRGSDDGGGGSDDGSDDGYAYDDGSDDEYFPEPERPPPRRRSHKKKETPAPLIVRHIPGSREPPRRESARTPSLRALEGNRSRRHKRRFSPSPA